MRATARKVRAEPTPKNVNLAVIDRLIRIELVRAWAGVDGSSDRVIQLMKLWLRYTELA